MNEESRGWKIFKHVCGMCHSVEKNGSHGVGPNLHGIIGSRAGTKPHFQYSDALMKSKIVWNEINLRAFIVDPNSVVPGLRMGLRGLKRLSDERAVDELLAYILEATK